MKYLVGVLEDVLINCILIFGSLKYKRVYAPPLLLGGLFGHCRVLYLYEKL